VQFVDGRVLEPDEGERHDVQRRERVHAVRHVSVGNLHGRLADHVYGERSVPHGGHLRPVERNVLEPCEGERHVV
jgi:hypothetical protein